MAYLLPFPISVFLFLLILILSLIIFMKKTKSTANRPPLPPSPPKLPIIGNLHQVGDLPHQSLSKLSKKYGPIMLMHFGSKPTLVISSAEMAREVLKTHDDHFCSRPSLVGPKRLSYDFKDIALTPFGEYWRQVRKICVTELFNTKRVQSFGYIREQEVAELIKSVSESVSIPLNLTDKSFSVTSRIICRIAFGKTYQVIDSNNNNFDEFIHEAMKMIRSFAATDFFPYFGWIIDLFSGFSARLDKCFNVFDAFYQQLIDEHLDPLRSKSDMKDIIDVLHELKNDHGCTVGFTTSHIKAILKSLFLGGVDTGAVTMVWAMSELARKPGVMKKVQDEIRNCIGRKGKVEESDIENLVYLKMVVKETLRLHPPAPLLIPRECMNHCTVKGYSIYPKTRVFVNVWAIGRSSEYWTDPDEFIPERFEDNSIDFKGQDFEFLPFGSGKRVCPAINMGVATVELALANLLYCFNWELPNGCIDKDVNMEEVAALTVHKKFPLHLVPTLW